MTATRTGKPVALWVAVLLVVVMAGLYVASLLGFNLFKTNQSETTLLKSIQDTSKYVSAVGNFEVVVKDKDANPLMPNILSGRQTLFAGAGTVNAYVNFSGFSENDLTYSDDGKTVVVRLPEAKLDKPNLDQSRSGVVSQDLGVLDLINDALSVPDQAKFYKMAEEKIAAAAEKSELKKRATENTKTMLTGMFSSVKIQATFK
ncbi:DUF4230 domain-containing protein [Arthrobacter glacialis]|uniref:DUF4230 domain-containing protein n=1 Tax=Arthrobacter glacialis TaxID=1664 RepID=UPI000CD474F5|nr:DUF4230 domain-containing protein [Arthrobacter glacialis]POH57374.1 hypothetical protein CVS28_16250 [Arthrobacter glacialis]